MRARASHDQYQTLFKQSAKLMLRIQQLPVPVIARVHGIATAAGCRLVVMLDLAVAASSASDSTRLRDSLWRIQIKSTALYCSPLNAQLVSLAQFSLSSGGISNTKKWADADIKAALNSAMR